LSISSRKFDKKETGTVFGHAASEKLAAAIRKLPGLPVVK